MRFLEVQTFYYMECLLSLGFVRDCRVFAVFAGFIDNTSGSSAYEAGWNMGERNLRTMDDCVETQIEANLGREINGSRTLSM